MKKWLLRIGAVIGLIIAGLVILVIWTDSDRTVFKRYVKNENLPTIKPDWPGTPVDQKDRFVNHEFPFIGKTSNLLKWQLSSNPFKEAKKNDTARLEVKDPRAFLDSETDGILWLGHASFLIRLDGVNILLDPIFGKPPLVTVYVSVPSPIEKIKKVDYVLISHDHRDHCDARTLEQIAQKFPNAVFLGGLGMEDILNDWKTETNGVRTAGWFQQFDIPDQKVKVFFVPVRHWARRGLFDTNQRLWGGYVIQSEAAIIYFGGDSGYGQHYKEVGELFPNIDYFLIGIGAYEPRWFMEPNHNSPGDALKAFQDSRAKTMIPMHFGRFDLSDEPPNEPLRALMEEAGKSGVTDKIKFLTINESLEIK
ncbi:MAG: MBL fold metallo-hydrolase [Pyrinomonadaceae bacterium]